MKRLILSLIFLMLCYTPAMATVSSNINTVSYSGDGVSTSFAFNNNIYLNTDLNVYEVTSGIISQLTLNTNYSIALTAVSGTTGAYTAIVSLAGGSLPSGALPVGTTLYLMRNLPYTQLINISDYVGTPASTWNQALDRATILSLQNYNRSVLQPITATAPTVLPSPIANLNLCFDPTATFITTCSGTAGAIAIPITTAGYVNGSALTGSATLTSLITSGNVGIGSTNPTVPLAVNGQVYLKGNVGIGSFNPGQVLDVQGTVRSSLGIMDVGIGTAQQAHVCVQTGGTFVSC